MRRLTCLLPLIALVAGCSRPDASAAQPSSSAPLADSALPSANRTVPPDFATLKMSFAPVARRAAPAVVNISSKRVVRTQVDPFFAFFGGMGVPRERVEGSLGSGVIVRADGVIVTNNHVVEGGQEITVSLADKREFPAKVLLADARSDLAVLKIDLKGERLPVLPFETRSDIQVGDLVLAFGDPFGVGPTVTNGIVSGLSRTGVGGDANDFSTYIQTDAAINPGNSGGPLVDMDGNIVGLNTFILSRSGSSSGVGFAIPAPLVRRVVESAVGGATVVRRPWLGLRLQAVDAETARSLGLDRPQGVLVAAVYPAGPADRAGVRAGDIILSADGAATSDEASLNYAAATHRPGESLTLSVRHGGATRSLSVRLETPPADPPRDERTLAGRQPLAGATVINLSPAAADQYGLDPFLKGVVITKIGGLAARTGFQPGDIVRAVNGRSVASTAALAAALQGVDSWRVTIVRGGQEITAEF